MALRGSWDAGVSAIVPGSILCPGSRLPHIFVDPEGGGSAVRFLDAFLIGLELMVDHLCPS